MCVIMCIMDTEYGTEHGHTRQAAEVAAQRAAAEAAAAKAAADKAAAEEAEKKRQEDLRRQDVETGARKAEGAEFKSRDTQFTMSSDGSALHSFWFSHHSAAVCDMHVQSCAASTASYRQPA